MPDYGLQFNPNQMSLSELTQTPLFNQAMGAYGSVLPNIDTNALRAQFQNNVSQQAQGPMQAAQEMQDKANQMQAYKAMAQGVQGMAQKPQPLQNTVQIMHDNNQFRFAGNPQQQMANALRRR